METDRLTIKDAVPFAVVILVTLAVIGFIVAAPTAHADVTKEATPAQGNVSIEQEVIYVSGDADLIPSRCNEGMVSSGASDVYSWEPGVVSKPVDYKVTVTNSAFGSPAYFRTIIALEASANGDALTFLNANVNDFTWRKVDGTIEVEGVKYVMYEAVYKGSLAVQPRTEMEAQDTVSNEDQLASGSSVEVVYQVAMKSSVVSSQVETLGGGYNIMVVTQAVAAEAGDTQTVDASILDTAFGTITASKHPWSASSEGSSTSTTEASGEVSN